MSVFGQAMEVLANDPNLAVAGTFTPAGGGSAACRVLLESNDQKVDAYQVGARAGAYKAEIPSADVATRPVAGDTLTVGARTFVVRDVEADALGISWRVDLDEAS